MRRLLAVAFTCLTTSFAQAQVVTHTCLGLHAESCFILIEGEIRSGIADTFREYSRIGDMSTVYLNSRGGNLGAAIELGRAIREAGFQTVIGGTEGFPRAADGLPDWETRREFPQNGNCESACVYAFMGGKRRYMPKDARLGVHRFHTNGQEIGSDAAQELSGILISYLIEMGIDARFFVLASGEAAGSTYSILPEEALKYELITTRGYGPFYMEPFGAGVIATARRSDSVDIYDQVQQVTAYCHGGRPHLLMFSPNHWLDSNTRAFLVVHVDGSGLNLPYSEARIRITDQGAYISGDIGSDAAKRIVSGEKIWVSLDVGRASGQYFAEMKLSDMDRQMISAAFRFCIG